MTIVEKANAAWRRLMKKPASAWLAKEAKPLTAAGAAATTNSLVTYN
jgi:hypothetical protein